MTIRPKVTDDENLFFDWDETEDEEVGHEYLIWKFLTADEPLRNHLINWLIN